MAEFKSVHSYRRFAQSIREARRYLSRDHDDFLEAVRETCRTRIEVVPKGTKLFRAQKGHDWRTEGVPPETFEVPAAYKTDRMKPPLGMATEGRVNARGRPCLYLATHRESAIGEVRPWVGSYVSVGVFEVIRDMRTVNTTSDSVRHLIYFEEPSIAARESENWSEIDRAFARPIDMTENGALAEYEPTQILSELFQGEGIEGISYRSSLGPGHNAAFFDLSSATLRQCGLVRVNKVAFESREADNAYTVVR